MLMCNQHTGKLIWLNTKFLYSGIYSLSADSCVHQKMRVICAYIGTVSAASTGYTDKSHNFFLCLSYLSHWGQIPVPDGSISHCNKPSCKSQLFCCLYESPSVQWFRQSMAMILHHFVLFRYFFLFYFMVQFQI